MRYLYVLCGCILSWWPFMAIHELGHILSALWSGAEIRSIQLAPWELSHTHIIASPTPLRDAWAGPLMGVFAPLLLWVVCRRHNRIHRPLLFFAGFCLLANGAYLGVGWMGPHGDCKSIIEAGGSRIPMVAFGIIASISGMICWQRLDTKQTHRAHVP